jgi:hypothetical protein
MTEKADRPIIFDRKNRSRNLKNGQKMTDKADQPVPDTSLLSGPTGLGYRFPIPPARSPLLPRHRRYRPTDLGYAFPDTASPISAATPPPPIPTDRSRIRISGYGQPDLCCYPATADTDRPILGTHLIPSDRSRIPLSTRADRSRIRISDTASPISAATPPPPIPTDRSRIRISDTASPISAATPPPPIPTDRSRIRISDTASPISATIHRHGSTPIPASPPTKPPNGRRVFYGMVD